MSPLDKSHFERFFSSGDSLAAVSKDLDRAFSRGEFGVVQALSPLQVEIEERRGVSMALARSYLRNSALPTAQVLQELQRNQAIDETSRQALDDTYQDTAEHIAVLLKERQVLPTRNSDYYKQTRSELTGGISELATFALSSRLGRYANMLLLPSTDSEDIAGYDQNGFNLGIDFKAYLLHERRALEHPIAIQIKTGRHAIQYAPTILNLSLSQLTPQPSQAHTELPQAIVRDARGESTQQDKAMISQTSRRFLEAAIQHYEILKKS